MIWIKIMVKTSDASKFQRRNNESLNSGIDNGERVTLKD